MARPATKVVLVDEMAAFTLVGAVVRQATKDLRYKTTREQDRITAARFLEDLRGTCRTNGQQSGRPNGQPAGTK